MPESHPPGSFYSRSRDPIAQYSLNEFAQQLCTFGRPASAAARLQK
jgi:hypothetical protein